MRRRKELDPIETEREALVEQRLALEDLRRQLTERVAAVQEREEELRAAIGQAAAGKAPTIVLPPRRASDPGADGRAALERRARELDTRERDLAERERRLARPDEVAARSKELDRRAAELDAREQALADLPPPDPDAARLAAIETRLVELRDAEKAFLRTQQELAARSEAVAARERLVSQKERELGERDEVGSGGTELRELESRLRRLESRRVENEQAQGFEGGVKRLAQEGTRKRPA